MINISPTEPISGKLYDKMGTLYSPISRKRSIGQLQATVRIGSSHSRRLLWSRPWWKLLMTILTGTSFHAWTVHEQTLIAFFFCEGDRFQFELGNIRGTLRLWHDLIVSLCVGIMRRNLRHCPPSSKRTAYKALCVPSSSMDSLCRTRSIVQMLSDLNESNIVPPALSQVIIVQDTKDASPPCSLTWTCLASKVADVIDDFSWCTE